MDLDQQLYNQAMGQMPGAQQQAPQVLVRFYTAPVEDKKRSAEEGRPIYKEAEFIQIRAPGSRDYQDRPVRPTDKQMFAQQYAHWQNTKNNDFEEGTPLSSWPQITASQVEELRFFNCTTVEHLAELTDDRCGGHLGILSLKHKAQKFLAAAAMDAPVTKLQEQLDEKERRIEALENSIQEQAELIRKLSADNAKAPKRRGRPPKVAEE